MLEDELTVAIVVVDRVLADRLQSDKDDSRLQDWTEIVDLLHWSF